MAKHTSMTIGAAWTLLTDSDTTNITFLNQGPGGLMIAVTVGATPPTDFDTALTYRAREGERNVALADLAPGISGTRVYAYSEGEHSRVYVSHA